jgi:ATP-dependent DNA ligase
MSIERMRKRFAVDRASFIEPCPPSPAPKPPAGPNWIHEIKHDGFRLMARRDPVGIRLITGTGNDWTNRYPLVVEAVNHQGAVMSDPRRGGVLRREGSDCLFTCCVTAAAVVFQHACKMGLEGIVSKRLGSRYRLAGRPTGSNSKIQRLLP